ncbi:LOW QUALITY PROTEIN: hypothetical protein SETIT_9G398700v2 [Setaria italica]|uniref:diacylglycerol O-acyltransferase n=1 Tax=Setaria italica TaxID=4555 RepID=A0A368SQP1_SETIT|nr:LOW QUALITY PROTEIN: hypothetical protein SETIT_9G398700v2 [Setaria italica]
MGPHGASPVVAPPPPLSMDTRRRAGAFGDADDDTGESLSPTARMFHDFCIVAVVGLCKAINSDPVRAGLEVLDGPEPRWVRTTVNLDDHIIVPDLDPAAISADADRVLEDYVASLSTLPMDQSRPLWEVHVLDFPTSEAASAAVFRIHHALGDGTSLVCLLLACTRAERRGPPRPCRPCRRPRGAGRAPAPRRPAWSAGALALARVGPSCAVLAWHTLVDVARFVAMALRLVRDPPTVFTAVEGVEFRRKRFVMRTLSLKDVKLVKHALGCTVNDVLVGVTTAALSRYYFRKLDK